jgi:SOS response regulatory protein OraA/RecX
VSSDEEFNKALVIALKAIAASDKLVAEVAKKLAAREVPAEIVDRVLEHLTRKKILDDDRVVQHYISASRVHDGNDKLKQKLLARGAPEEIINRYVEVAADEPTRAREALQKHFKSPVPVPKAARFLASRGFAEETIEQVVEEWTAGTGILR